MTPAIADEQLERLRRHGFGVAYRMLGSVAEAEDIAQEALVRLLDQPTGIDVPAAWMTTVTTRLSINVLRSARVRRESYVGPWLPEPLVEDPSPGPESRAETMDALSLSLLALLERLTPTQRAAFLLREVFGYEYAEIGQIIDSSEAGARQLVSRARTHLEAARPRFDVAQADHDALLQRFLDAAEQGDLAALEELLADDAVLYADSGGKAMAPPEPLIGPALIARFMAGVTQARRAAGGAEARLVRVNGELGRIVRRPGREVFGAVERAAVQDGVARLKADVTGEQPPAPVRRFRTQPPELRVGSEADMRVWEVLTVDVDQGRIRAVNIVRNADKLDHLAG